MFAFIMKFNFKSINIGKKSIAYQLIHIIDTIRDIYSKSLNLPTIGYK